MDKRNKKATQVFFFKTHSDNRDEDDDAVDLNACLRRKTQDYNYYYNNQDENKTMLKVKKRMQVESRKP